MNRSAQPHLSCGPRSRQALQRQIAALLNPKHELRFPTVMSEKDIIKETRPRIEHAIRAADLGLNPSNDGKLVRIPIPPLTEERRKQLAKQVHEIAEEHRTAVRNIRRDANEKLKKMLKDKAISEDNERDGLDEVQKLTDNYISKIDDLSKSKEHEIVSV